MKGKIILVNQPLCRVSFLPTSFRALQREIVKVNAQLLAVRNIYPVNAVHSVWIGVWISRTSQHVVYSRTATFKSKRKKNKLWLSRHKTVRERELAGLKEACIFYLIVFPHESHFYTIGFPGI